jgi:hypothetical protein
MSVALLKPPALADAMTSRPCATAAGPILILVRYQTTSPHSIGSARQSANALPVR